MRRAREPRNKLLFLFSSASSSRSFTAEDINLSSQQGDSRYANSVKTLPPYCMRVSVCFVFLLKKILQTRQVFRIEAAISHLLNRYCLLMRDYVYFPFFELILLNIEAY